MDVQRLGPNDERPPQPHSIGSRDGHRGASSAATATFGRDRSNVPTARHAVREYLQQRSLDGDVIADLELIVSELVTNVVLHGTGDDVTVQIEHRPDAVAVTVGGEATRDAVPDADEWRMVGPKRIDGRGLAIVAAIATSVDVDDTDGHLSITATRTL